MTQYFAVRLEDYFVPRGWSGWTTYFTSMDDLRTLIAALKKFNRHPEVIEVFEKFQAGSEDIRYQAGCADVRFVDTAELIAETVSEIGRIEYEFKNVYKYKQHFRISSGIIRQAVFFHDELYWHCIKVRLHDVQRYNPYFDQWDSVGEWFWGFPGMIQVHDDCLINTLWIVEGIYGNSEDALDVLEQPDKLGLHCFWRDISGNG